MPELLRCLLHYAAVSATWAISSIASSGFVRIKRPVAPESLQAR